MTPNPIRPQPRNTSPFVPCAHGLLEMPKLHEDSHIPPPCLCWKFDSPGHIAQDCPVKTRNRCCKYCNSNLHWSKRCLFKCLDVLGDLDRQPSAPKWCGKCFRHNPSHKQLQCPSYEYCCTCGEKDPFMFLCSHRCTTPTEVDMVNDPETDIYDLID